MGYKGPADWHGDDALRVVVSDGGWFGGVAEGLHTAAAAGTRELQCMQIEHPNHYLNGGSGVDELMTLSAPGGRLGNDAGGSVQVSTSADDDDVAVLLQSIVGDLMGRPGTNDSARVEHHPLIVTSTRHPLFTRWCVEFPLSLGNVGQITVSESPGGTTSSWWTVVDGVLPSAAELMHSAVIPVTVSSVNDA